LGKEKLGVVFKKWEKKERKIKENPKKLPENLEAFGNPNKGKWKGINL